jgi:uncharacterized membrane protein
MMNGYWGFGMWGGAALMILFWVGVILLALWGAKLLFADRRYVPATREKSAVEIAQLRYSRGELSHEEYLALLNDLKQSKEKTQ